MKLSKALGRSILYAGSTFYMKGISLFMVPLVVSYLQVDEYGRLEFITSLAIFLSVLVGFGLEDTLYRFAGQEKTLENRKRITSCLYGLVINMSLVISCSLALLLFLSKGIIDAYISPYLCCILILTLALEGIISIPLGWMRMNDRFKIYCSINIIRATVQALLTFLFLFLGRGVEGIFEAGLIASVFVALVCFAYQKSSTGISFCSDTSVRFIKYALPIVASGFLAFSLNGFDRWILLDFTSLEDLALYAVTGKFAIALTIAMQPFGMWWSPIRFSLLNEMGGREKVSKYATYGLLQIIIFSLLIGLFAPILIILLFPPEFKSCISLIAPLLAVYAIKESAEFLNLGCFSTNSTKTQLKITLASACIGVALMILITPMVGLIGLITSLFIAQFSKTLLMFFYSQKIIHLSIKYIKILLIFIMTFSLLIIVNAQYAFEAKDAIIKDLILSNLAYWVLCFSAVLGCCLWTLNSNFLKRSQMKYYCLNLLYGFSSRGDYFKR